MTPIDAPIRILVVDDDPGVRGLLTVLFKREGWSVTTAADGELAVEQLTLARPDVVILDLMLPKLMGLEVLGQIIANDSTCGERVLILTAISEAELRKLPTDLPVRRVIRKPFDNADLVRSVKACRLHDARPRPRAREAL